MAISSKRLSTKVRIVAFVLVTMSIALFLLISTGRFSSVQEHVLPDGSTLILTSVSFTGNKTFLHGSQIEKILGDALPTNGIAVSKMKLVRATKEVFSAPNGKSWLIAELKLTGSNAQSNPFVRPTLS